MNGMKRLSSLVEFTAIPGRRPLKASDVVKPGTVLQFATLADEGDKEAVLFAVEDRGPRVLITDIKTMDWKIKPTRTVNKEDLAYGDAAAVKAARASVEKGK